MRIKRVIIAHYYQPSTAATNRIFAYAKGFAEKGVTVFLVLGDEKHLGMPDIEGVNIVMVEIDKHRNLANKLSSVVKKVYKPGESVIMVYGSPLMCWYLPHPRYNIFYECTEIPFYGRKKTLSSRVREIIKLYLARRATGMFVISKALADYFTSKGVRHIAIINMFVDRERFNIIDSDAKEKYIAYCGTISPFKDGVDCLIKAFASFFSTHPNYTLKLIGRFESDDAEKSLKGLVDSLNIANYVEFTGMVKPAEMPQLLCGANMLALARPDNEQARYGFPTKLGEYLATGKPVVVTRVGEIGKFLKDGVNCRMSEPGNPEAFADCMSWIADNYNDAIKLGVVGKELTKSEFSSDMQSKKALEFINSIVGDNGDKI